MATIPGAGHVNPLLPLARAAAAGGHVVRWATGSKALGPVVEAGLDGVSVGPDFPELLAALAARTRGRPGDGVPSERLTRWFAPRLFGEVATPSTVDDLLLVARSFRPDAVLFDSRCYAGPLVAAAIGALPVMQAVTRLLPRDVEERVSDAVTPLWRSLGLPTPELAGAFDGLVLSAYPASLDVTEDYGPLEVLRLAPAGECPPAPLWLADLAERPLVYVTLGTVFSGAPELLRALLDGVAATGASVLLTMGSAGDPATLGELPPHVRVERFVPQESVLPHCAAVVSHGGSGTMLGAVAHGLPHVAVPQGADQFVNAEVLVRHRLGAAVLERPLTAQAVTTTLTELLSDHVVAVNARTVGREMADGLNPEQALAAVTARLKIFEGAARHPQDT